MKIRQTSYAVLPFLLLLSLSALLLGNAQSAMDGIRRGLTICTETLIPALFPFLVLSELIVRTGTGEALGRALGKPFAVLLGISQNAAGSVLLGLLCGQPVSTVTALSFCRRDEMKEAELKRISLFANNPSSGFLIGAVGIAFFGNKAAGVALFCITASSGLLVGTALHLLCGKTASYEKKPPNGARKSFSSFDITDSIRTAFFSLLQICAFLLFFCALGNALDDILAHIGVPPVFRVLVVGVLEMTSGISYAITTLPAHIAFRCIAFFCGFAGLSVCMQILCLTEKQKLRPAAYLFAKLAQGILNLLLCELYLRIFDPELSPSNSMPTFSPFKQAPLPFCFLGLLLLVWGIFAASQKAKKGT